MVWKNCQSPCSSDCLHKNCDGNGICTNCSTGTFGVGCDLTCSQHCVSGCDQLSGKCIQCEVGRYGSTCQSECSAGCRGFSRECNRDGSCIDGCRNGYFGKKCNSTCPEQCYEGKCDREGTCSSCKAGYYGSSCAETCGNCTDRFCNSATGECTNGCLSGYYGSLCILACENCEDGDCDRKTGECAVSGKWISLIIGGAVLLIFVLIALFIACCLKRIHDIMKNDVNSTVRNTPVQFVPKHGTQLRSVELWNAEHNGSGANMDVTYNHLFDIKPQEASFIRDHDDLETSSGYCAVRPLFGEHSDHLMYENDDCSGKGDDGGSLISICEANDNDRQKSAVFENVPEKIQEITSLSQEERLNLESIQIVALQPAQGVIKETIEKNATNAEEETLTSKKVEISALCPDEEVVTVAPKAITVAPNIEEVCGDNIKNGEDETMWRGCTTNGCSTQNPKIEIYQSSTQKQHNSCSW